MKLNKHGRPYTEPDKPKRSIVTDKEGNFYHPTKAPDGLCKCGIMLALAPKKDKYVFPSVISAQHAISHTGKYLKSIGVEFDYKNFLVRSINGERS